MAHLELVAVLQRVGALDPRGGAVDEGAVRGDVVEPPAVLLEPQLHVPARDEAARVGQAPADAAVAADLEDLAGRDGHFERAAIGQARHVGDAQAQCRGLHASAPPSLRRGRAGAGPARPPGPVISFLSVQVGGRKILRHRQEIAQRGLSSRLGHPGEGGENGGVHAAPGQKARRAHGRAVGRRERAPPQPAPSASQMPGLRVSQAIAASSMAARAPSSGRATQAAARSIIA